jgi:hypothetical protein
MCATCAVRPPWSWARRCRSPACCPAFLYLLPNIGSALPYPWNWDFANLFPSTAAQQITSVAVSPASHALQVGPSYALLVGYAIGIPCLAAWLLYRRDA